MPLRKQLVSPKVQRDPTPHKYPRVGGPRAKDSAAEVALAAATAQAPTAKDLM